MFIDIGNLIMYPVFPRYTNYGKLSNPKQLVVPVRFPRNFLVVVVVVVVVVVFGSLPSKCSPTSTVFYQLNRHGQLFANSGPHYKISK